jgi:hypothetical protein
MVTSLWSSAARMGCREGAKVLLGEHAGRFGSPRRARW